MHFIINGEDQGPCTKDIPYKEGALHAVVDVYGTTKQVKIIQLYGSKFVNFFPCTPARFCVKNNISFSNIHSCHSTKCLPRCHFDSHTKKLRGQTSASTQLTRLSTKFLSINYTVSNAFIFFLKCIFYFIYILCKHIHTHTITHMFL